MSHDTLHHLQPSQASMLVHYILSVCLSSFLFFSFLSCYRLFLFLVVCFIYLPFSFTDSSVILSSTRSCSQPFTPSHVHSLPCLFSFSLPCLTIWLRLEESQLLKEEKRKVSVVVGINYMEGGRLYRNFISCWDSVSVYLLFRLVLYLSCVVFFIRGDTWV